MTNKSLNLIFFITYPLKFNHNMEIKIDGTWIGFYEYEKSAFYSSTQVPFIAHLVAFGETNFEGVIEDDVTNGGLPALANVKGTLSEISISFVKTYPSHKVFYKGKYEEAEEKFTGIWQISVGWSGYWEMKKGSIKNEEKEEVKMEAVIGIKL